MNFREIPLPRTHALLLRVGKPALRGVSHLLPLATAPARAGFLARLQALASIATALEVASRRPRRPTRQHGDALLRRESVPAPCSGSPPRLAPALLAHAVVPLLQHEALPPLLALCVLLRPASVPQSLPVVLALRDGAALPPAASSALHDESPQAALV